MELINIEAIQNSVLTVFTTENGVKPYIQKIVETVEGELSEIKEIEITGDLAEGMKLRKKLGTKVNKSKNAIDEVGGELYKKLSAESKLVSAERSKMRTQLDELREKVLEPVKAFEEAEKARITEIQSRIDSITALPEQLKEHGSSSEIIAKKIEEITTEQFDYQEIQSDADAAKFVAIQKLTALKAEVEKAEIEAKEAEAKRLEAEKIAQAEREAQIKADAEARAQAEIEAAKQKAEQERLEADRKAKEEAARIKAESEATIRRAEEAQKLADERAKQAEENAKLEAQRAVEAEKRRVAQEERDKADAEAQRKASEDNQRRVNREALDSMIECGFDEATAKKLIGAIAKGAIKNISINY